MGNSRYLKEQNPAIQIVGLQPMEGASIPGIRRWPEEYLPKIYNATRVDRIIDMAQREAEDTTRRLAREERHLLRRVLWRCRGRHVAIVQGSGKRGDRRDHL